VFLAISLATMHPTREHHPTEALTPLITDSMRHDHSGEVESMMRHPSPATTALAVVELRYVPVDNLFYLIS
jgi:hypothetical protein